MNQIEEVRAAVDAELAAYGKVLDEYEETLSEVEETLTDSQLDQTESAQRRIAEATETEPTEANATGVSPAGAD